MDVNKTTEDQIIGKGMQIIVLLIGFLMASLTHNKVYEQLIQGGADPIAATGLVLFAMAIVLAFFIGTLRVVIKR